DEPIDEFDDEKQEESFADDTEAKSGGVGDIPLFNTIAPNEFKEKSKEFKNEPIDVFKQDFQQPCDGVPIKHITPVKRSKVMGIEMRRHKCVV
ncbi:hypothetical protein PMAYCL1PPCAC_01177, partial [Pristionchus mayeri]